MDRKIPLRIARMASLLAVLGAMVFASAAFAQDSQVRPYGGQGSQGAQAVGADDQGAAAAADTTDPTAQGDGGGNGILPFTGLDVGFLIGGGLLLIAAGATLARFGPQRESQ